MDRRKFLGATAAMAAAAAYGSDAPLPRRPYKNGIYLSIIAFGGIVVCGLPPEEAARRADSADRERWLFAKNRFGVDARDPLHYALVLNTDALGVERTAQIIVQAASGSPR